MRSVTFSTFSVARQFGRARLGQEAVGDVVVFGGGIALQGAVAAVVIGHDQPVGRHEGGRAAGYRDDGAHRMLRQIGQLFSGNGDPDALQFGLQLRQLMRLPLTFVGVRGSENTEQGDGQCDGFQQDIPRE
jgi:hypothetical protein